MKKICISKTTRPSDSGGTPVYDFGFDDGSQVLGLEDGNAFEIGKEYDTEVNQE